MIKYIFCYKIKLHEKTKKYIYMEFNKELIIFYIIHVNFNKLVKII